MKTYFFDSHGGLWEVVGHDYLGGDAEAFGPRGMARRMNARELYEVLPNETAYAAAKRQDLIGELDPHDGWAYLDRLPMDDDPCPIEETTVLSVGGAKEFYDGAMKELGEVSLHTKGADHSLVRLESYITSLYNECKEQVPRIEEITRDEVPAGT